MKGQADIPIATRRSGARVERAVLTCRIFGNGRFRVSISIRPWAEPLNAL